MGYKTGMRRALCLALTVACVGADPPERAAPPRPAVAATGPTTLPAPVIPEDTTVRLISPGAEPRRPLRYHARIGAKHTIAYAGEFGMELKSAGHRMLGQQQDLRGRVALEVTGVEPDGNIHFALQILEMTIPDNVSTGERGPNLAGARGTFTMSDRGVILEQSLRFLEDRDEARVAFHLPDYVYALPTEPVGLGATWEVHTNMLRNGISFVMIERHRLVALDANTGRTEFSQELDSPGQLGPGLNFDAVSTFEVSSFRSTGSGSVRFAFDQAVPVATETQLEFLSGMQVRNPRFTQDVAMTMSVVTRTRLE
jgi:hypothetical protein